jgi:hypothetical protein
VKGKGFPSYKANPRQTWLSDVPLCSVHFRLGVGTFGGELLRPTHLTPVWGRGRVGGCGRAADPSLEDLFMAKFGSER